MADVPTGRLGDDLQRIHELKEDLLQSKKLSTAEQNLLAKEYAEALNATAAALMRRREDLDHVARLLNEAEFITRENEGYFGTSAYAQKLREEQRASTYSSLAFLSRLNGMEDDAVLYLLETASLEGEPTPATNISLSLLLLELDRHDAAVGPAQQAIDASAEKCKQASARGGSVAEHDLNVLACGYHLLSIAQAGSILPDRRCQAPSNFEKAMAYAQQLGADSDIAHQVLASLSESRHLSSRGSGGGSAEWAAPGTPIEGPDDQEEDTQEEQQPETKKKKKKGKKVDAFASPSSTLDGAWGGEHDPEPRGAPPERLFTHRNVVPAHHPHAAQAAADNGRSFASTHHAPRASWAAAPAPASFADTLPPPVSLPPVDCRGGASRPHEFTPSPPPPAPGGGRCSGAGSVAARAMQAEDPGGAEQAPAGPPLRRIARRRYGPFAGVDFGGADGTGVDPGCASADYSYEAAAVLTNQRNPASTFRLRLGVTTIGSTQLLHSHAGDTRNYVVWPEFAALKPVHCLVACDVTGSLFVAAAGRLCAVRRNGLRVSATAERIFPGDRLVLGENAVACLVTEPAPSSSDAGAVEMVNGGAPCAPRPPSGRRPGPRGRGSPESELWRDLRPTNIRAYIEHLKRQVDEEEAKLRVPTRPRSYTPLSSMATTDDDKAEDPCQEAAPGSPVSASAASGSDGGPPDPGPAPVLAHLALCEDLLRQADGFDPATSLFSAFLRWGESWAAPRVGAPAPRPAPELAGGEALATAASTPAPGALAALDALLAALAEPPPPAASGDGGRPPVAGLQSRGEGESADPGEPAGATQHPSNACHAASHGGETVEAGECVRMLFDMSPEMVGLRVLVRSMSDGGVEDGGARTSASPNGVAGRRAAASCLQRGHALALCTDPSGGMTPALLCVRDALCPPDARLPPDAKHTPARRRLSSLRGPPPANAGPSRAAPQGSTGLALLLADSAPAEVPTLLFLTGLMGPEPPPSAAPRHAAPALAAGEALACVVAAQDPAALPALGAVRGAFSEPGGPAKRDLTQQKASNGDLTQQKASNGDLTQQKASNGDLTQQKASNGDLTQQKASNGDLTQQKASNGDLTQQKASNGDLTQQKASNGDLTQQKASNGDLTQQKASNGDLTQQKASNGDLTQQKASNGDLTQQKASNGDLTQQKASNGDLTQQKASNGDLTQQKASNGDLTQSNGDLTQQKASNGDLTQQKASNGDLTQSNGDLTQQKASNGDLTQQKASNGDLTQSNGDLTQQKASNGELMQQKVFNSELIQQKASHGELAQRKASNGELIQLIVDGNTQRQFPELYFLNRVASDRTFPLPGGDARRQAAAGSIQAGWRSSRARAKTGARRGVRADADKASDRHEAAAVVQYQYRCYRHRKLCKRELETRRQCTSAYIARLANDEL
ncbi:hypothetical protein DIPPA_13242 [Diplonema papillatum]|nr:hypothetical protein DIPPA_13242 [Diplonema papillatum]